MGLGSKPACQSPGAILEDALSIVLSAGCSTAYFATLPPYEGYVDQSGKEHAGTNAGQKFTEPPPAPACYQKGKHNGTSMGEQLLRKNEHGAIAYFGCNTGGQPCGITLLAGFTLSVGNGSAATLGDAWEVSDPSLLESRTAGGPETQ